MTTQPATSLEDKIGYRFRDKSLLDEALLHPSAVRRKQGASVYERLEFVGDRVLGLAIATWLYRLHPDATEGVLARHHASLVRRDQLAQIATGKLDLLSYMTLAKGDEADTRGQATILGDAFEALLGAIYLDSDFPTAEKIVHTLFDGTVTDQVETPRDPKTALQEWAQARGRAVPTYTIIERTGPSHAPVFTVEVAIAKEQPVRATGTSKQLAEKAAAEKLLQQVDMKHDG